MIVQIQIRSVYGVNKVYPHNDTAKAFAAIAGTTTLTKEVLAQIKLLGYEIHHVHESIEWEVA